VASSGTMFVTYIVKICQLVQKIKQGYQSKFTYITDGIVIS